MNDGTSIMWWLDDDDQQEVGWPEARERVAAQLDIDEDAAEAVLCAIFTGSAS